MSDFGEPFKGQPERQVIYWKERHAIAHEDLATLRRKLEEAEKERDAWREIYTAEVLLDDTDYTQPDHDAAVQRLVKATEALTPMQDGTLGRYLDQCREFVSKQVVDREAHWDHLNDALRVAGELADHADYFNEQTRRMEATGIVCDEWVSQRTELAKTMHQYRALTADGPTETKS